MVQFLWKIIWQFLKMLNIELPCEPSKGTLRYIPKIIENIFSCKNMLTNVHSSVIHDKKQKWEHHKCPSIDEWINKEWYSYKREYYSAIKRSKLLVCDATWVNLENIMLSKRRQTQKTTFYIISFIRNACNRDIDTDRNPLGLTANRHKVSGER